MLKDELIKTANDVKKAQYRDAEAAAKKLIELLPKKFKEAAKLGNYHIVVALQMTDDIQARVVNWLECEELRWEVNGGKLLVMWDE